MTTGEAMSEVRDVPESWPVESSADLHRDAWVLALRSDRVRRPGDHDEAAFRRLVVEHPGAAVVLAVDEQDRVLCIRQYRHPARARLVELPGGVIDHPGEAPEDVGPERQVDSPFILFNELEVGLEAHVHCP